VKALLKDLPINNLILGHTLSKTKTKRIKNTITNKRCRLQTTSFFKRVTHELYLIMERLIFSKRVSTIVIANKVFTIERKVVHKMRSKSIEMINRYLVYYYSRIL